MLATVFKNNVFIFGELRIAIHNFNSNMADFVWFLNDLSFFQPIYQRISAYIISNSAKANMIGSFYSLICFLGYFIVVPIHYFVFSKSKFKFLFANILAGIYGVLLLVNYLVANRPGVVAMYMPNVARIAVALMAVEILLSAKYFQFNKARTSLKAAMVATLAISALNFNYLSLTVPVGKLEIPRDLYAVIEYAKQSTPADSVILHNLALSSHYAYFAGFAYRSTVMERWAYGYAVFKGGEERARDVTTFFKTNKATERIRVLDKYSVTHVLLSPETKFSLSGGSFNPVFSSGEYALYSYIPHKDARSSIYAQ
jgi:hypothetical protein